MDTYPFDPEMTKNVALVTVIAGGVVVALLLLLRRATFPRVSKNVVAFFHPFASYGGAHNHHGVHLFSLAIESNQNKPFFRPQRVINQHPRSKRLSLHLLTFSFSFSLLRKFYLFFLSRTGGGERVLWVAIQSLQRARPDLKIAIFFEDDRTVTEASLCEHACSRFNVHVDPSSLQLVRLRWTRYLTPEPYPRFTMIGQARNYDAKKNRAVRFFLLRTCLYTTFSAPHLTPLVLNVLKTALSLLYLFNVLASCQMKNLGKIVKISVHFCKFHISEFFFALVFLTYSHLRRPWAR